MCRPPGILAKSRLRTARRRVPAPFVGYVFVANRGRRSSHGLTMLADPTAKVSIDALKSETPLLELVALSGFIGIMPT